MNVTRKVEVAKTAILSISRHDDETADVVLNALNDLVKFIGAEADAFTKRKADAAEEVEE